MAECPRCHQTVKPDTVTCPFCRTPLKGFGHPGIPLHYAEGETYLCQSCLYNEDDSCTLPQRPYAKTCTLYYNQSMQVKANVDPLANLSVTQRVVLWSRRNSLWLGIGSILLVSLAVNLLRSR